MWETYASQEEADEAEAVARVERFWELPNSNTMRESVALLSRHIR